MRATVAAMMFDLESLRHAVETAGLGLWRYDLATGALEWSERTKALYGLPADTNVSYDMYVAALHPDDRAAVVRTFELTLTDPTRTDFEVEHRSVGPDGTIRWVVGHGRIMRNQDGTPTAVVGTSWDITDRKQAEIELAEAAQRLDLATRANAIGIFDWDVTTGRVIWTEQEQRLFGLEPGTFDGNIESWSARVHPEDLGPTENRLRAAMDRGADTIDFAFRVIWSSGTVRCLEGAAQILYDGFGAPLRMIGVNIDVTARREAERTLQLQAMLLDRMTEGVSLTTEDGTIVYTNKAEDELFGYAPGELIGKHVSIQNAYPAVENHARVAAVIESLKRDGAWTGDWNNRRKDGSEFITSSSITTVEIEGRRHFLCVQRDVQEERRLEQQQRERDIRLQMAMSASGLGDWAWDVASDDMRLSDQAASLFGLAENTRVKWAELKRLVHVEDRAYVDAAVEAAAQADEPFSVEHRINRADTGETRWLALRGRTTRYPDGQVQGVSGILRDATDEHLARERERLLAREVDHRAKNALAVVQSLVRLTPFTSRDDYIATIAGRVDAMARVHTLLSQNAWSGASVGEIVTQELAAFHGEGRLIIEGPEIHLRLEAAQPFSLLVHELSTNAAKHGALSVPQGKVAVRWSQEGDGSVALTWTETGGPRVRKPERLGFGSKLIKGSAAQLAGRIEKEWAPAGLRCRLRIGAFQTRTEVSEPTSAAPQPAQAGGLKGARVLLVEDEVLLAMETADHLEAVGAIPVGPANTLEAGMTLAQSGDFDCAVLDLNLGGLSAEPIVGLLKARDIPLVVVTGYESVEFRDVVVLRKPVNHTALLRALADQVDAQLRRSMEGS